MNGPMYERLRAIALEKIGTASYTTKSRKVVQLAETTAAARTRDLASVEIEATVYEP
jgi:hypothetical protein